MNTSEDRPIENSWQRNRQKLLRLVENNHLRTTRMLVSQGEALNDPTATF